MATAKICAIHQPNFFPRLSTLAKLYAANVWVVLDDVQYNGRDYQNRCRLAPLKANQDWQWLSLPVHRPNGRHSLIADVRLIEPQRSKYRTLHLLKHHYRRSQHWPLLDQALLPVLAVMRDDCHLADVAEASTLALLRLLGWQGQVRRSSELTSSDDRSTRLADLTAAVGADTYLCGTGGRRYLDTTAFTACGLTVEWFESPAAEDEALTVWSQARQISALWALMRFGPTAVGKELDGLV